MAGRISSSCRRARAAAACLAAAAARFLGNERVKGADRDRLAALGATRPGAGVPGHDVEVKPARPRVDEIRKEQSRGDSAREGAFAGVVDIGDLAVDQASVGLVK